MTKKTKGNAEQSPYTEPSGIASFLRNVGLAQRYRPRRFEDLIGQPEAVRLKELLATGKLHRAISLSGPPGVGKTSKARIIGACLNCEAGGGAPTLEPCGVCDRCNRCFSPDGWVIDEFDGMDRLTPKQLQDGLNASMNSSLRVNLVIFNEVEAFPPATLNVLHRPLEEPPAGIVFILCTSDSKALPRSIRSRCQEFQLVPVPFGDVVAHLEKIAKLEGAELPKEVIEKIARQANGSVRGALNRLERELLRRRP